MKPMKTGKNILFTTIILFAAFALTEKNAHSEELFFTYVGPSVSYNYNFVKYQDWIIDKNDTVNYRNSGFTGGIFTQIFVGRISGEMSLNLEYDLLSGSPDLTMYHLTWTGIGKFAFYQTTKWSISGGLGVYLETPPATNSYDGGGAIITSGFNYKIGENQLISTDIYSSFGNFGLGQDSSKINVGVKVAYGFKVGRI